MRRPTLQFISDLHLERIFKAPLLSKTDGKYLALLGDIGNPFKNNYLDFITQVSYKYEKVFVLSGNHEYWNDTSMEETDIRINTVTDKFSNVHYLNNDHYHLDNDYTVLGTTLWSHIDSRNREQNNRWGDHGNIKCQDKNITVDDINTLHSNCVTWLEQYLSKMKHKKIIVLSHHLPSYKLIIQKYHKKQYINVHDRFASNLDYLISNPIEAWLCGHSHCKIDTKINDVHCAINAGFSAYEAIPKTIVLS